MGLPGWTSGQRAGRKSWNYGFGLVISVTASSRAIRDPCQRSALCLTNLPLFFSLNSSKYYVSFVSLGFEVYVIDSSSKDIFVDNINILETYPLLFVQGFALGYLKSC